MKRAHRIALRPTPEQESLFGQHAGYARFAYNWALGEFRAGLDMGEWLPERSLRPRWNRVKRLVAPWGSVLSQNAAKYAVMDLGRAVDNWSACRRRLKAGQSAGRRVGFPRFKRRKHEQGFRADNGPDTVRVDGKAVLLPKMGRVAMSERLRFAGSIREVSINRTAGTWFASFCIEDGEPVPPVKDGPTVGVDVGVGVLAVCSDGMRVANPRALKAALHRLRQVDRAIARSRNTHGRAKSSNRRERLYERRRSIHARTVNVRNDKHHKATATIAKYAGRVVVERLNVAGMLRNRRLARSIADAGISGFLAKLAYKCAWYGAELVRAERWFPSSRLCAQCGWHNGELRLADRRWRCGGCGALNERDGNAAENLKRWPGLSFPVSGRGGRVSQAMPAVADEASMNLPAASGPSWAG